MKNGMDVQILHPPSGPCLHKSRFFVFLASQHLLPSSLKGLKLLCSHTRNQASLLLTYHVSLLAIYCPPHSIPMCTALSAAASPCLSHWCWLLDFAGASPPPGGLHGRPSAWLCSPAGREGWNLIAELLGRKFPGERIEAKKAEDKKEKRTRNRTDNPEPNQSKRESQRQFRGIWGLPNVTEHTKVEPAPTGSLLAQIGQEVEFY